MQCPEDEGNAIITKSRDEIEDKPSTFGAIAAVNVITEVLVDDGDSLPAFVDDSPLERGELVCFNNQLSIVMRCGYGDYMNKVRICNPEENPKSWDIGKWVSTTHCRPVRAPMKLVVKCAFLSANSEAVPLHIGLVGQLVNFDKDGDLEMKFEGIGRTQFVYVSGAGNLVLEAGIT